MIWNKRLKKDQSKNIERLAICLDKAMATLYKILDDQMMSEEQNQGLISLVGKTIAEIESFGKGKESKHE